MRKMSHPLARIRHFFPTIRFMLVNGAGVAFTIAMLKAKDLPDALMALGWLMLCLTVLFIDPENPPHEAVEDVGPEEPVA